MTTNNSGAHTKLATVRATPTPAGTFKGLIYADEEGVIPAQLKRSIDNHNSGKYALISCDNPRVFSEFERFVFVCTGRSSIKRFDTKTLT